MTRLAAIAAIGLGVAGCGPVLPIATAVDAERGHVELAELQRGRALLVTKCGGACHRAPMPDDRPAIKWPAMVDAMAGRAGLDRGQRDLIERYLVTMAERSRP